MCRLPVQVSRGSVLPERLHLSVPGPWTTTEESEGPLCTRSPAGVRGKSLWRDRVSQPASGVGMGDGLAWTHPQRAGVPGLGTARRSSRPCCCPCCWQGSCFPLALPGPDPVFRTRSLRSAPQRHCDRTWVAALAWTLPPLPPCLSPGAVACVTDGECNRAATEGCHTPGLAHLVLCLISDP